MTVFGITIIVGALVLIYNILNPKFDVVVNNNKRFRILWYSTSNGSRDYIILWQL